MSTAQISANIRRARRESGMKQHEMSIPLYTYRRLEKGQDATGSQLYVISQDTGYSVDFLVTGMRGTFEHASIDPVTIATLRSLPRWFSTHVLAPMIRELANDYRSGRLPR